MSTTPELPTAVDLAGRLARLQALVLGEPERARVELREVLRDARLIQAKPQEVEALIKLARCDFLQGYYDNLRLLAQEAVSLSRAGRLATQEAQALNLLGLAYQRQGALDEAMRHFLDCLRLSRQILINDTAALVLGNIAMMHAELGEHELALRLNEQALEVAQSVGNATYTVSLLTNILQNYFHLEQHPKVLELADEAILLAHSQGMSRFECYARLSLGHTLHKLGRAQASFRVFQAGLRVARWAQDKEMLVDLESGAGRALLALGDYKSSEATLQDALGGSVVLGSHWHEAKVLRALEELALAQGQTGRAAEYQKRVAALNELLSEPELRARTEQVATQYHQQFEQSGGGVPHAWNAELMELTRTLKRANMELAHRAAHDSLTGALNRPHFQMRLQKLLDFLGPEELVGVVICSVDHMKSLNDLYGQTTGDALLAELSKRLSATLRPGDLVGRLGNDEFVIMLNHLSREADLESVMNKVLLTLRAPFQVQDQTFNITASLGGVLAPRDGQSVETLFGHADLAVQQVKAAGRNDVRVFQPHLSAEEQQRRTLTYELRGALERGEFQLYYQPQYRLVRQHGQSQPGQELLGFEALIRWQHPRLGLLSPGQFIPLAEESRLILDIGDWVLHEACRQTVVWALPARHLKMAVNVSALQFRQPNFIQCVRSAIVQSGLSTNGLNGHTLELELTESMVHHHEELAHKHLNALQSMNVSVALDDFGTGFSSLSLLQNMTFQTLKIDRSFLKDLHPDAANFGRARNLVALTVNLAQTMNMEVIAEGVETTDQLELLLNLGCDQAQGYLLGRPAPLTDLKDLLGPQVLTEDAR